MTDQHDWDAALDQMKQVEEQLHAAAETPTEPEKTSNSRSPLLVGVIAVVIIVMGGIFATTQVNQPAPVISEEIPGDPVNFDPPSSLQEVQQFAGGDVRFLALTMSEIREDGTIKLSAADNATAEYVFVRGNVSAGREYVTVIITDENMTRNIQAVPEGDSVPDLVVPPNCSIAELWLLAKTYDAPSIGTAFIEYDVDGYHFVIDDFDVDLQFNENCILMR